MRIFSCKFLNHFPRGIFAAVVNIKHVGFEFECALQLLDHGCQLLRRVDQNLFLVVTGNDNGYLHKDTNAFINVRRVGEGRTWRLHSPLYRLSFAKIV